MFNQRIHLAIHLIIIAVFLTLPLATMAGEQQESRQKAAPEAGTSISPIQDRGSGIRSGATQEQAPGAGSGLRQGQGQQRRTDQQPLPTQNFFRLLLAPKLATMLVLAAVALILLLTGKMNNRTRIPFLVIATFLYGVSANLGLKIFSGFSMHPSPICAFTKSILYGLRAPMLAMMAVILFLSLIGPRLFCSYVCPVGAIQELIAMLADKLRLRRRKPSFRLSQTVRVLIFLLFVALSWTAIINTETNNRVVAVSLYDYLNAFEGFKWDLQPTLLDNLFHFLPLILTLIFAFFTYRPFCYFVCPVGLFTNMVEQIAIFRVRKKKDSCTDCQLCVRKAPCPAIAEILKDSALVPDCYACTLCTNNCPRNLLKFGL